MIVKGEGWGGEGKQECLEQIYKGGGQLFLGPDTMLHAIK